MLYGMSSVCLLCALLVCCVVLQWVCKVMGVGHCSGQSLAMKRGAKLKLAKRFNKVVMIWRFYLSPKL